MNCKCDIWQDFVILPLRQSKLFLSPTSKWYIGVHFSILLENRINRQKLTSSKWKIQPTSMSSLCSSNGASMMFLSWKFSLSTSNLWPVTLAIRSQCRSFIALLAINSNSGQHSLKSSIFFFSSLKASHSFRAFGSLRHLSRHQYIIHSFFRSFIHSFIHSVIHSFIHSLTHLLTHSLTHSLTHPPTHSPTHTHSFPPSLPHSLTITHSLTNSHSLTHNHSLTNSHSPTHKLTHSLTITHSLTHSLTNSHSLTHKLTHLLTHSFIHSFI